MPGCYVCVLVSWFSCNKWPPTEWFKTTQMSCLSVLEGGNLNLWCGWGHAPSGHTQGDCALLFQPLGAPGIPCGHITPISASAAPLPPPLCVCFIRIHMATFKTHPDNLGTTLPCSFLPYQIRFPGSRDDYVGISFWRPPSKPLQYGNSPSSYINPERWVLLLSPVTGEKTKALWLKELPKN